MLIKIEIFTSQCVSSTFAYRLHRKDPYSPLVFVQPVVSLVLGSNQWSLPVLKKLPVSTSHVRGIDLTIPVLRAETRSQKQDVAV